MIGHLKAEHRMDGAYLAVATRSSPPRATLRPPPALGPRPRNRAVDSVQVIEELIAMAKDISAETARGTKLGLDNEELAFYITLAENGSARELMAHEQLRLLAQMLVRTLHSSGTITKKESVRAKTRIEVRKLLARYGYPPDLQRAAVDLVIRQAEYLAGAWA